MFFGFKQNFTTPDSVKAASDFYEMFNERSKSFDETLEECRTKRKILEKDEEEVSKKLEEVLSGATQGLRG